MKNLMVDSQTKNLYARTVAKYWIDLLLKNENETLKVMAHPIACVNLALEGEIDPEKMGVPIEDFRATLRSLASSNGRISPSAGLPLRD